jgi:hypothetical protein
MCSQAPDPRACEERLSKMKDVHDQARQACEGKKGDEARDCMQKQMCAQSKDPARCEGAAKERAAERARIREACKGKTGDELLSCIHQHRAQK